MSRYIELATAALAVFVLSLPASAGEVAHVSGGVGVEERADLQAKEKDYNLKVVAAKKTGEYLAGVRVVIESAEQTRVLDTKTDGPILLAKLVPGTYTVKATAEGTTLLQNATVGEQGIRQIDFRF